MRFTSVLYTFGALALGGCAYLIPDNPSAPRYSTVMGERHAPELNKNIGQASAAQSAPIMPIMTSDMPPAMPSSMPAPFPPVDAATQATASQQMAMNSPVPTSNAVPMPQPIGDARQVPAENLAEAAGAPAFSSVPARPAMSGPESDADQLNKVRAQLEMDRANAEAARNQLSRDAAAEPSLLGAPTSNVVPPPTQVIERPLDPLPPAYPVPAMAPSPAPMPPAPAAPQPQPQSFIAPAPLMPPPPAPIASAQAAPLPSVYPVAAAPAAPALDPIMLRPPVASMPPASAPAVRRVVPQETAPSALPMASGGFNPMAASDSNGYLPQSRYAR